MPGEVHNAGELEQARWIRPGNLVAWGQACAEPLAMTTESPRRRAEIGNGARAAETTTRRESFV
ncbi:hypothetical protein [Nocardia bovistercoris]|uniref:Uncharacterized protein n=1 Tax=Nocardia bovistercoris TaxID=2785916 RepID=A0A931I876_9NOCA|nr:hypothetical protein [Nocardia bovistercoris]MBH0776727.1 hypothetical protein [Nocardia bovistercoris]